MTWINGRWQSDDPMERDDTGFFRQQTDAPVSAESSDAVDAARWRFARDNGLVWADRGFESNGSCTPGRVGNEYAQAFIDQRMARNTEPPPVETGGEVRVELSAACMELCERARAAHRQGYSSLALTEDEFDRIKGGMLATERWIDPAEKRIHLLTHPLFGTKVFRGDPNG